MERSCAAITALVLMLLAASGPGPARAATGRELAAPIEAAHGLEAWRAKEALQADIEVTFGGQPFVQGKLLFRPDMSASRLELAAGPVLVFDGDKAWVSPAAAQVPRARFHLLTWPYFIALPFKLGDPGTRLEPLGERTLQGVGYPAARLTFDPGVGDTPEDWYVVYRHPETGRLHAVAYIVTYGTSLEEANKEPHALVYGGFQEVEGVTLATQWSLFNWSEQQGIHGEPIARGALSNLAFVTPPAGAFTRPADSREDPLPGRP